jgi:predicted protein tyrosine phosphatase
VDLDWLTPALAVGGAFPTAAAERLAREHAIRRIVDLRSEACDEQAVLARHGIVLLHLPTDDNCAIAPAMLRDGVRWVGAALDGGHKVLVHCQHGIGRSALLALCVLVSRGQAPLDALERAKRARRIVSPSPAQLEAFIGFVGEMRAALDGGSASWPLPSFDALAAIAYRVSAA